MSMTRQRLRQRNRAARVRPDADIPPYEPQTGDIVTAFFRFSEETVTDGLPEKEDPDLGGRMQPDPKFRTCLVLRPKDKTKPPVLVPISSSPDRHGRHVAITDAAEQDACDLREGKDAYAKILEARKFHMPAPLIVPSEVAGDDGSIDRAWVIGKAPEALLRRVQAGMQEQARAGKITGFFEEKAGEIPQHTLDLMHQQARASRQHLEGVQARAASRRAEQASRQPRPQAPDQAPAPLTSDLSPEELRRRQAALRAAKAQDAADKLARNRGEHPEQTAPARANAEALAQRRGTHPDQVAARRAERDADIKNGGRTGSDD